MSERTDKPIPADLSKCGRTFGNLVAFCSQNPPVFQTAIKLPDSYHIHGFRFLSMPQPVFRIAIEADGSSEAIVRLFTFRGDSRAFLMAEPQIYAFSQRELFFVTTLARTIHNCSSSIPRSFFVYSPNSYFIHRRLLLVDAKPAVAFREVVKPWSIQKLLCEARRNVREPGPSPQSMKERRKLEIPNDLLLNWFIP
jgi:hypothetical protein